MRVRLRVTSAKAILLLAALQTVGSAQGVDPALTTLFPPRPSGYLTDVARVLDTATILRLSEHAERLRGATGAELAVVVLPTIGDRAAAEVAVAIGRAWGVGAQAAVGDARRNAGVVILLVPRRPDDSNSGQIFIATGRGVEGFVTDLQAGRVRDLMRPHFQRGDYAAGLEAGVRALAALIAQGMGVTDSALLAGGRALARQREPRRVPGVLIALVVIFVILLLASGTQRPRRGRRSRRGPGPWIFWGGGGSGGGGGFGGFGGFGGGGGGGFGGFGGGGGFSGGGAGGRF